MFENQNQKSLVKKQNQTGINSNLNISRKNSLEIGESIQGTIDKSRKHTKSSRKKITQPINPKNYMLTIETEAKTLSNQTNNNATSNNSTANRIISNNSNPISRNFKKNLKQQKNEASFPNGIDGTQLMKKTIVEYRKITEEKMKG